MEIEGRRFLVTGGASQVGTVLTERLLAAGAAEVRIFDVFANGPGAVAWDDPRVSVTRGDVLDLDALQAAAAGCDGVFATAAVLTLGMQGDPRHGLAVNVTGLGNALEAARLAGAARVVMTSSVSVYGDNLDGTIDEARPFGHASLSPPFAMYALSKLAAEQLGRWYTRRGDVEFVSCRLATVYGEHMHTRGANGVQMVEAYESAVAGKAAVIVGQGDDVHDYIYVGDVAGCLIRAMQAGRPGEAYNVATGVQTPSREVVRIITRIAGSWLEPVHVVDERAARPSMNPTLDFDLRKTAGELGWRATTSLEAGLGRMVAWLRTR